MSDTDCIPSPLILLIWLLSQLFHNEAGPLPGYCIISDTTLTYSSLEILWCFKFFKKATKRSLDSCFQSYSLKSSFGKDKGENIFPLM